MQVLNLARVTRTHRLPGDLQHSFVSIIALKVKPMIDVQPAH
jgi:hypothetical protein